MSSINLSTTDTVEGFDTFTQHVPGRITKIKFNVKGEIFNAALITPFGQNPSKATKIVAWVYDFEGKVYSPENFFSEKLGNLWKSEDQSYRFLTLYGQTEKIKVRLNKSISKEYKNDIPLACFKEEGSVEEPSTYINKETVYGRFIYNISTGNLIEAVKLNPEEIKKAYPCLSLILDNITRVRDDLGALEWFNENKINTIDDILAQKVKLTSFEQVSKFFQKLFEKKNKEDEIKYSKGILAIISKSFAYIPRN